MAVALSAMMPNRRGTNGNLSLVVRQLKKERDRVEKQLSALNVALAAFVGAYYGGAKPTSKKRTISAAGRRKIAAAQRARWAKMKAGKKKAA
jgi:hypothetical protein